MKAEATATLNQIKDESSKTIEEARKLAQQIEEKARLTAAHISVKDAQNQFKEAELKLSSQVKLWAWISGISVVVFLIVVGGLSSIRLPEEWKWQIIYYSALKLALLGTVGAFASFSFRILRAHLHMREHNRHRQRIANSMAAFVESAVTPEQRDLILAQLVNAVATFGSSGLLYKQDDFSPKMTIDTINRTINSPPPKS